MSIRSLLCNELLENVTARDHPDADCKALRDLDRHPLARFTEHGLIRPGIEPLTPKQSNQRIVSKIQTPNNPCRPLAAAQAIASQNGVPKIN
ncbi:MAG: hypothetical protein ABL907_16440 [Hyphomicrobium sp.]